MSSFLPFEKKSSLPYLFLSFFLFVFMLPREKNTFYYSATPLTDCLDIFLKITVLSEMCVLNIVTGDRNLSQAALTFYSFHDASSL